MKRRFFSLLIFCILCLFGCGIQEQTQLIFYGNENADAIISKKITIEDELENGLLEGLKSENIVSKDTKVCKIEIEENDNEKRIRLDLSKEFGDYFSTMGSTGEYIIIGSLVNTYLTAYDADSILITVNGENLETGHQSYGAYLNFYGEE